MKRPLRAGIVGGGRGAFIGAVHRIAAGLDGEARIVAGALSSDPANAAESAAAWYLERSYTSFENMALEESQRADGIDFVIIATPNHMHFTAARAFLTAGIHVFCEKPLACSVVEADELVRLVEQTRLVFAVAHTYTGYPLIRQAHEMVRRGDLGRIRKVQVEYNQDWLMDPIEHQGNKQAQWRLDPARAGISCCVGDIGSHAENLLEFVTGLRIESLCADLTSFGDGRVLDDDASILLRLQGGAKGTLVCSQVACGEENNLAIRLYGTKAGLEWQQQNPNTLIVKPAGSAWQLLRAGQSGLAVAAQAATRTPAGHPEGYLEAFANLYRMFYTDVRRVAAGEAPQGGYPDVHDGQRGLRFVSKAVESSQRGAVWVEMDMEQS